MRNASLLLVSLAEKIGFPLRHLAALPVFLCTWLVLLEAAGSAGGGWFCWRRLGVYSYRNAGRFVYFSLRARELINTGLGKPSTYGFNKVVKGRYHGNIASNATH